MSSDADVQGRTGTLIYFSSVYLLFTGALYEVSYWSRFSINIFEYIGITDVVKQAIFPVGPVFTNFLAGVILNFVTPLAPKLESGGGSKTGVGRFLNKHLKLIGICYLLIVFSLAYLDNAGVWVVLPALIALPAVIFFGDVPYLQKLFPDDVRTLVGWSVIMLPLTAYGTGRVNSDDLLRGRKFNYVVDTAVSFPATDFDVMTAPRYIGRAGEDNFFYDPKTKFVSISKLEDGKSLTLGTYPHKKLAVVN